MPGGAHLFHAESGRRRFLQTVLSSATVAVAAQTGLELADSEKSGALASRSPETAFQELVAGNRRFAANQLTSIEHDLDILKKQTADKQEPFAAILACADSRVPVELIFDQTIGRLFVARVAGNIVTPEIIASLEYSVAVLGVRVVVVLGHSNCGAVKAAMKADPVPGQISTLYPHLQRAVEQSGGNLEQAIKANTQIQAQLLRNSSTVIRDALNLGNLKVGAAVYDLASGSVSLT